MPTSDRLASPELSRAESSRTELQLLPAHTGTQFQVFPADTGIQNSRCSHPTAVAIAPSCCCDLGEGFQTGNHRMVQTGFKAHLLSTPCHGTPPTGPGCSRAQEKRRMRKGRNRRKVTIRLSLSSLAFTQFHSFQVLFPSKSGALSTFPSHPREGQAPLCALCPWHVLNS